MHDIEIKDEKIKLIESQHVTEIKKEIPFNDIINENQKPDWHNEYFPKEVI